MIGREVKLTAPVWPHPPAPPSRKPPLPKDEGTETGSFYEVVHSATQTLLLAGPAFFSSLWLEAQAAVTFFSLASRQERMCVCLRWGYSRT